MTGVVSGDSRSLSLGEAIFGGEFPAWLVDIGAASARASWLWASEARQIIVEVEGGTNGLARTLWQSSTPVHKAVMLARKRLRQSDSSRSERYSRKKSERKRLSSQRRPFGAVARCCPIQTTSRNGA